MKVLNKKTSPQESKRWHIILQGHPEELLDALEIIKTHEKRVIQTAEWIAADELLICLRWIDPLIAMWVQSDIEKVSGQIKIKLNGEAVCHGHNIQA